MVQGFSIRKIEPRDYLGVIAALNELTSVGTVDIEEFSRVIEYWKSCTVQDDIPVYNPYVVVDDATNDVAATGNLIIEQKLIHNCALCGHIEDIAVSAKFQGKKLGKFLIDYLTDTGLKAGCYKVILDCDEKNVKFYEKCGYSKAGVEMQIRE
ncbi:hypothetical protein HG535_0H02170 [Zygotorulaspora mrakii]|uniref:Glucosamine 6-phosphate N-acetyltransferase n=1 Tax=Zygotorulaspora mrakii TaxID=42260 RepID=A0A7H9B8X0_ZYGMR|nr:uncharacterized protein HG535_0H02170 [Zygotorulaspora mrakii]QLG74890.1 hypothetical protein HG535_0H02170 [Zygotorulaspora mrakii]